jgi:hypothetical protein
LIAVRIKTEIFGTHRHFLAPDSTLAMRIIGNRPVLLAAVTHLFDDCFPRAPAVVPSAARPGFADRVAGWKGSALPDRMWLAGRVRAPVEMLRRERRDTTRVP